MRVYEESWTSWEDVLEDLDLPENEPQWVYAYKVITPYEDDEGYLDYGCVATEVYVLWSEDRKNFYNVSMASDYEESLGITKIKPINLQDAFNMNRWNKDFLKWYYKICINSSPSDYM